MEWWKNGILGMKSGKYLNFNLGFSPCILKKSHSAKPIIPTFHYSNTPWHLMTAEPTVCDPCNPRVFQVRVSSPVRRRTGVLRYLYPEEVIVPKNMLMRMQPSTELRMRTTSE
jgi:hypothetical protein